MTSRGKRSSILKKQQILSYRDASPTAASSSVCKSSRKIEFNRKKSIKEFLVGEDTDTIWGNSYEVSTDGTPSNGLDDLTVINNTSRSLVEDQNKENLQNQNPTEEPVRPSPNNTNTSWDLSITIAEDEKRRIRSDAVFSQSLNTTDRLLVEPVVQSAASKKVRPNQSSLAVPTCEVQAMDISPMKANVATSPAKSPRKMIYYHPKQEMFVEINDVPEANVQQPNVPRIVLQTPAKSATPSRVLEEIGQSSFNATSCNVSETWNSHPLTMMNHNKLPQSNFNDLTNMSSDVDTTLAITNTVAKLLESVPNLTIPDASNMYLDESTTTDVKLPTNALARARPSFLPTKCPVDESQDIPQTPPTTRQESESSPAYVMEDTNVVDISSPLEGQRQYGNLSLENLSILNDLRQSCMVQESMQMSPTASKENVDRSASSNRHGLTLDFAISSLSLKLPQNSPETPAVNRPKILRPTLPSKMFDAADEACNPLKIENSEDGLLKSNLKNKQNRSGRQTESVQTTHTEYSMEETSLKMTRNAVVLESDGSRTYLDPKRTTQSRMTVAMEESMKQPKSTRPTVYDVKQIVEESTPPSSGRTTLICNENMEMTRGPSSEKLIGTNTRRSIYDPKPVMDMSMKMEQSGTDRQGNKKCSIKEALAIFDQQLNESFERQQETRRTFYQEETIQEDKMALQQATTANETPSRRTVVCNDSMVLDLCTKRDEKTATEASFSCRLYGDNFEELSIFAASGGKSIDMTVARPTTFNVESCEVSVVVDNANHLAGHRAAITNAFEPSEKINTHVRNELQCGSSRLTTYARCEMEEDIGPTVVTADRTEKENASRKKASRMTDFNAAAMEETIMAEEQRNQETETRHPVKNRLTSHVATMMDETNAISTTVRMEEQLYPAGPDSAINLTTRDKCDGDGPITCEMKEMETSKIAHPRTSHVSSRTRYSTCNRTGVNDVELKKHLQRSRIYSGSQGEIDAETLESYALLQQRAQSSPMQKPPCAVRDSYRLSTYHKTSMDATEGIKNAPLENEYPNESGFTVIPADVTNYNAFLVHHEMSQDVVKHPECTSNQRLTTNYMESMQENGLDSTRLSKEREQIVSERVKQPKPSMHSVKAMDETNVLAASVLQPADEAARVTRNSNYQEIHEPLCTDSSAMQMSPEANRMSTISSIAQNVQSLLRQPQRSRRSIYQPKEMDSTLVEDRETQDEKQSANERPSGHGSWKLQNMVQQTAVDDVEGVSWLANDSDAVERQKKDYLVGQEILHDDAMQLERMPTVDHQSRGTILFKETDDPKVTVDSSPSLPVSIEQKLPPICRPTIFQVEAMMEDTVAIHSCNFVNDKKPSVEKQDSEKGFPSLARARKSGVCMEETMLPVTPRVERRESIFDISPIMCTAEHPPSFQCVPSFDTIYGSEETIELTKEVTYAQQVNRMKWHGESSERILRPRSNRQTIHQSVRMDMGGSSETVNHVGSVDAAPEPVPNRRTIYNSKPMEETPPHCGSTARHVPGRQPVSSDKMAVAVVSSETEKTSNTIPMVKPRQTILIPQDMEVEFEEERPQPPLAGVKEEEQSCLALLPREMTEDRVLRCAPVKAGNVLRNGAEEDGLFGGFRVPSVDDQYGAEVTKMTSNMQCLETVESKLVDHASTRFIPPSSTVHELTDISMCNSTLRPELPHIGNITATMSMREITETLLPTPFHGQSHSVSVICRVDGQRQPVQEENRVHESLAFASVAPPMATEVVSEDEFFDAEGDTEADRRQVDPLSLTKSSHLTMKFIDVEQLEETEQHLRSSVVAPSTTSKRLHTQLLGSPTVRRPVDVDPLQMTTLQPVQPEAAQQTPQGPMKKRPRNSCSPAVGIIYPMTETTVAGAAITRFLNENQPVDLKAIQRNINEEVLIKDENPTAPRVGSQTIIYDPTVFAIEEQDLLDDESNLPCTSFSGEAASNREEAPDSSAVGGEVEVPDKSIHPFDVAKFKEVSFYRVFADLTVDSLGTMDEAYVPDVPAAATAREDSCDGVEECGSDDGDQGVECISLSDDDSLTITPPKKTTQSCPGNVFDFSRRLSASEEIDSTMAKEFIHELRQQYPQTRHACCKMETLCLCRTKRELDRREEACEVVWGQFCTWFEAIKQRASIATETNFPDEQSEERRPLTLEEQIEELNWRMLRTNLEQSSLEMEGMSNCSTRRRSRSPTNGQFPETPSVVYLSENFRSYLLEQTLVDNSPPPGAKLPAVPRITYLISNKLSSDSGTRWQLDCSEEHDGLLVFRHRTLRSVVISVQLQQRPDNGTRGKLHENRRLERIQVRECQQEYVHSPKLLLAHIEYMRLAKETTERTLRSTYRTVGSLMGLWQRFDELLRRVFDSVNRLVTIVRNNDALLYYDAQGERFFVKKYLHRENDDGTIVSNVLMLHFNWIGSMCAAGVSFKRLFVEAHKLLPGIENDRNMAGSATKGAGSTDDQKGLMFLECLLWNVTKYLES